MSSCLFTYLIICASTLIYSPTSLSLSLSLSRKWQIANGKQPHMQDVRVWEENPEEQQMLCYCTVKEK